MSSFTYMFLISGLAILGMMIALWLLSLALKNSSIVDIFWGPGFVLVAWVNYFLSPFISPAKLLMTILVTIWGLRLALHIGMRNWGEPEDFRYVKWREENGARWWWFSFFKVFVLQGVIMWIVSAPIISIIVTDGIPPLPPLALLGGLVWAYGFFFETVGDWQLARFIADPANKGKIMTTGVWKYTRHPNYFGDAAQWWGFYLIALSSGGWWTIFSPLLMTLLLVRVSGVALLEKTMKKKPGYEEYMKRTNAFIPWFPKN
jgi:steroid 5-alpha reductase family enzyme